MKLKYYMRGMGLGIILTTLILTIANPKEKLSDAEIIERAGALGMVTDESGLDQALEKLEVSVTPVPTLEPTKQPTVVPTVIPSATPATEPTKNPTKAPTKTPKKTSDVKKPSAKISITITRGMSSDDVADLLRDKGIIKNAENFNYYIIKKGKASVIRVGTYSLAKGTSYDTIIKNITTKKK